MSAWKADNHCIAILTYFLNCSKEREFKCSNQGLIPYKTLRADSHCFENAWSEIGFCGLTVAYQGCRMCKYHWQSLPRTFSSSWHRLWQGRAVGKRTAQCGSRVWPSLCHSKRFPGWGLQASDAYVNCWNLWLTKEENNENVFLCGPTNPVSGNHFRFSTEVQINQLIKMTGVEVGGWDLCFLTHCARLRSEDFYQCKSGMRCSDSAEHLKWGSWNRNILISEQSGTHCSYNLWNCWSRGVNL